MSELASLVGRVRRRAKDGPVRAYVNNNPLTAAATEITIRTGDVSRFKDAGIPCSFDDGTDELVVTSAAADPTTSKVAVDRAQDGTAAAEHVFNTPILIRPRFSNAELIDRIMGIVENELWPQVWLAGEASLEYQAVNEYYSPDVPDIEEIVYAYQLVSGYRYPLHVDYLSRSLADDANSPPRRDGFGLVLPGIWQPAGEE